MWRVDAAGVHEYAGGFVLSQTFYEKTVWGHDAESRTVRWSIAKRSLPVASTAFKAILARDQPNTAQFYNELLGTVA